MKLPLFGLSFLFISLAVYSQDTAPHVFNELQESGKTVRLRFTADTEKSELANKISNLASSLKDKWAQSNNRTVPTDYLKTLQFDSRLLHQALDEPNGERAIELLSYVHDDLSVKKTQSESIVGATGGLGAVVRVTVKTTRDGQGVSGYLVRCNPRRFADLASPMFVFSNETNPTTVRNLPPGNYEMWLERPNRTRISSKPITLGGGGETSEVITFEVP